MTHEFPDDLPTRRCRRKTCMRRVPGDERYCRFCTEELRERDTARTRRWREKHARELAARESSRTFSDQEVALRRARAYLATYIRRGKATPGECERCGRSPSSRVRMTAVWDDPAKPLEARWFCRRCLAERREATRTLEASKAALATDLGALAAELALLPPAERAAIEAAVGERKGVLRVALLRAELARRKNPGDGFFS